MAFSGQWSRYQCCPKTQIPLPSPPQNLMIFDVTGYYYSQTPSWFNEHGVKMTPIQFSSDPDNLFYQWTFYKPVGDMCSQGILAFSTKADVMPVIFERVSQQRMNVRRIIRHNGFTHWGVWC